MKGNFWANEEQLLLLKAALLEKEAALAAWQQWVEMFSAKLDDIDHITHQLIPLVYRNLSIYPIKEPVFERLKGIYRRNWTFNHVFWQKITPTLQALQQNKIQPIILLKGMAMMAAHYCDFGARVIGDLDILIPYHCVKPAANQLLNAGWRTRGAAFNPDDPYEMIIQHGINLWLDDTLCLDLHWSFLAESPFTGLDEDVFKTAEPVVVNGLPLFIPNATILLLQTTVHGAKSTSVASVRWIADAVTLLKKSPIDWQHLLVMAKKAHVCLPLLETLRYLQTHFQCHVPANVISTLQQFGESRFENHEYWCNTRGLFFLANWQRYCERLGYDSPWQKLRCLPEFLQYRARLKSRWHIPWHALKWLGRRLVKV